MTPLTLQRIDPFTKSDQIKALFLRNERPEFPDWFDRAYPIAMRDGGSTWVSLDQDGRVVAHMSAFKAAFWSGEHVVEGGLLCNLMADKAHRTFFPVAALIRRAVSDLREDGAEFLYTNPINKASVAVMRAAGLQRIGDQNRYLLPTSDSRLLLRAATGLHIALRRQLNRGYRAEQVETSVAAEWTIRERCRVSRATAKRYPELYFMRYGAQDTSATLGFAIQASDGHQVGAALVRAWPDQGGHGDIITLRCLDLKHVAGAAAALGAAARLKGISRLHAPTLMGTPFATALVRGGFFLRNDPWAIVGAGYTERGRMLIEEMASSDLEKIDVD